MKRITTVLALLVALAFVGGCCRGPRGPHGPGMVKGAPCPNCPMTRPEGPCPGCPKGGPGAAAEAAKPSGAIFWCSCDAAGKCSGVSAAPSTCPDGKPASGGHVVYTEGNNALVCTCGPGCSCAIDPKDRTKCGCGKPIQRIDLAGTGLWFCNCGGSCACNTVSATPARCRCGMELHQAR